MRVYDIALMLIRAFVAMDFIREGLSFAIDSLKYLILPSMVGNYDGMGAGRLALMTAPVVSLIGTLIILAFSKPLARFAAKLAATSDTANQF